jgi:hypothetical protein
MFKATGCIQGRGMDADKFYNVVWNYPEATCAEEAKQQAIREGMWVEYVVWEEETTNGN